MPLQRKKRKTLLLSSTRPRPLSCSHNPDAPSTTLSSTHTRTLIRQHHVLQKHLAAARAAQNQPLASALEGQIAASGGLARYQRASLAGQAKTRGGDSSGVLVRWLREMMMADGKRGGGNRKCEWRMLEVGALRVDNAAARSGFFSTVERIDLHAQAEGIVTQDFMERPLPAPGEEGFDVVSLSLVLNYVGNAAARGEMLGRVEGFLRKRKKRRREDEDDERGENAEREMNGEDGCFPGLFLVLPAPCVTNSRYLDEERLEAMMRWLGYTRARRKMSLKLVYYLWKWEGRERGQEEEEEEKQRERRRDEPRAQCDEEGEDYARKYNEKKNHPHPHPHQPNSSPKTKPSTQAQTQNQNHKHKRKRARSQPQPQWSSKPEIRKGGTRNNFAVVLK